VKRRRQPKRGREARKKDDSKARMRRWRLFGEVKRRRDNIKRRRELKRRSKLKRRREINILLTQFHILWPLPFPLVAQGRKWAHARTLNLL